MMRASGVGLRAAAAVPAVVILLMVLCGHEALTSELKRRRDNLIHKNIEQVCYSCYSSSSVILRCATQHRMID